QRVVVLTQNVDGLHREAGSRALIDIHGDLHHIYCVQCGEHHQVSTYEHLAPEPRCDRCGGWLRPDVVLFEEPLPLHKLDRLEEELHAGFDVVFSVGTSSGFSYIAAPVLAAARAGVPTIEINPGDTEVSSAVRHRLRM